MSPREWNNLLRAIENQLCILLVGPATSGILADGKYRPYTDLLAIQLAAELDKEKIPYDPDSRDNLAYIAQTYNGVPNATELDAAYFAQTYYKKILQPNETLLRLARLPFSLVINTTPDELVAEAFKNVGKFNTTSVYYNFRRPVEVNFDRPTPANPLIYNLFGSIHSPESLVLTAANQLDFIGKVMRGDPPLPPKLLQEFDNSKTYLFLGFDWRQWHIKLLLRALRLGGESPMLSPAFPDYTLTRSAKEIYSSLFKKITFVEDHIEQFVQELSKQFQVSAASATGTATRAVTVFVSSHPADEELKNALLAHLKILEQTGKAKFWHSELIQLGEDKVKTSQKMLEESGVVLVLISSEYLSDDVLRNTELLPSIAARRQAGKKVVPIILEPCGWDAMPELTQCRPILPIAHGRSGEPVTTWVNRDAAFANVFEQLKILLND